VAVGTSALKASASTAILKSAFIGVVVGGVTTAGWLTLESVNAPAPALAHSISVCPGATRVNATARCDSRRRPPAWRTTL